MPQRAKVSRVCFARNGISSGSPETELCAVPPVRKLASNRPATSHGLHRPIGDAAVGCLDLDHRLEPVERRASRCGRSWRRGRARRTRSAIALATLSAPSASAPESRGNVDRDGHARTSSTISSSCRHRAGRSPRRRASPTARRRRARGNRPAPASPTRRRRLVEADAEQLLELARRSRRRPSTGRLRRGRASAHAGRPAGRGNRDRRSRRRGLRRGERLSASAMIGSASCGT